MATYPAIAGYVANEKYEIARRYLLPKQLEEHGLPRRGVIIDKKGFMYIINHYAREAGVRNLERQIEKICRKIAVHGNLAAYLLDLPFEVPHARLPRVVIDDVHESLFIDYHAAPRQTMFLQLFRKKVTSCYLILLVGHIPGYSRVCGQREV